MPHQTQSNSLTESDDYGWVACDAGGEDDDMPPPDELWSRLRSTDAEFAQAVIESGAIDAEAGGCPGGTANHPTRLAKNTKNVSALDPFERGRSVSVI